MAVTVPQVQNLETVIFTNYTLIHTYIVLQTKEINRNFLNTTTTVKFNIPVLVYGLLFLREVCFRGDSKIDVNSMIILHLLLNRHFDIIIHYFKKIRYSLYITF